MENAVRWTNKYLVYSFVGFGTTYPQDKKEERVTPHLKLFVMALERRFSFSLLVRL